MLIQTKSIKGKQTEDDGDSGIQNVAFEGLTRLNDDKEVANFLTYGKWNLKDADIEHLMLEEERKERVGRFTYKIYMIGYI
jgi:hypothetical protein